MIINKKIINVLMIFIIVNAICLVAFVIYNMIKEKEVYIEKEPQISRIIDEPDVPYVEIYRAPCRDDELIECVYMRIYPSMVEEIGSYERSKASNSP